MRASGRGPACSTASRKPLSTGPERPGRSPKVAIAVKAWRSFAGTSARSSSTGTTPGAWPQARTGFSTWLPQRTRSGVARCREYRLGPDWVAVTRRWVEPGQAKQDPGRGDPVGNSAREGVTMTRRQPARRIQRVGPKPDHRRADGRSSSAPADAQDDSSAGTGEGQWLSGPPDQPAMQASRRHRSSVNYESAPAQSPGYPPRAPRPKPLGRG